MRIPPEAASASRAERRPPPPAQVERPSAEFSRFGALLGRVGDAVAEGNGLMARAAHGRFGDLDAAQLIALQVGVYRYSEAVDLAAKLVDRAGSAVRTVVSGH